MNAWRDHSASFGLQHSQTQSWQLHHQQTVTRSEIDALMKHETFHCIFFFYHQAISAFIQTTETCFIRENTEAILDVSDQNEIDLFSN